MGATMTTFACRMITVAVDRNWREVYDFAAIPENFARWAAGLGRRFAKAEAGNGSPRIPTDAGLASGSPRRMSSAFSITPYAPMARKRTLRCA